MNELTKRLYKFGDFLVDPRNRLLLRGSEPVYVTPKAFDLLLVFVENPGVLLEKEELIERIWGDTSVEEGNLARNISSLRKALGENPRDPAYIVTVAGHGYRFAAPTERISSGVLTTEVQHVTANTAAGNDQAAYLEKNATAARSFQIPPEGARRWTAPLFVVVIGLAAVLTVALAIFPRSKKPVPGANDTLITILVLPSRPSGAGDSDPASEFGLAASLIKRLSGNRSLVVRPPDAIVKYASIQQDPIEAGKEQKVNYVLSSNHRKSGEEVVFTATLIDVRNGSVFWSDTCKERCSTFDWQDALVEKTARSLLTALSDGRRPKHDTENQEAYDLFNSALYGWYRNTYDIDGLHECAGYLERAIALDPNYAAAYAMLGAIDSRIGQAVGAARNDYESKAEEWARRALEIDPTLIQAHLVLGVGAYSYYYDWARAEEHFQRARELNPNDVEVIRTYAPFLASIGKLDESVFWQRRACELQPLSFDLKEVLVMRLFIARKFDEAIQQANNALEISPSPRTLYYLWRSYEQLHMYDEAVRALQQLIASEHEEATLRLVKQTYSTSGYEKAREVYLKRELEEKKKRAGQKNFNPLDAAITCAMLGDRDKAFRWLEEAYEYHAQGLIYLKVNPDLDSLRSDPRYADLEKRIGFPM